jgi:hypothetical protein
MARRRIACVKELTMENLWGPDRGGSGRAEGATRPEGQDEAAQAGHTRERPAQLEDGDFVEAVSRAVLREVEGGSAGPPEGGATTGIRPNARVVF